MGHVVHHAIVVTTSAAEWAQAARAKAEELQLRPSSLVQSHVNADFSFLIGPDGSKTGWPENEEGDRRREEFKKWCAAKRMEANAADRLFVTWIEIKYGPDWFGEPVVTDYSGDQ